MRAFLVARLESVAAPQIPASMPAFSEQSAVLLYFFATNTR